MDFGAPHWFEGMRQPCIVCKQDFVPCDPDSESEMRCRQCQTEFRIRNAADPNRRNGWRDWCSRQPIAVLIKLKLLDVY